MVLLRGDVELATWSLADDSGDDSGLDLSLVDQLAGLQLAARRLGCSIRLRGPCRELCQLLYLAGLAGVVTTTGGLVVEVGGESEGAEERCVEEVVMPDDPVV